MPGALTQQFTVSAKIQIKAASTLGLFLLALQTLIFLDVSGALGLATIAAGAYLINRQHMQSA